MKSARNAMTLFELLIVVTIIGIVYSVGLFTLKKEKISAPTMNVATLKTTLLALSQSNEIRLYCDVTCHDCRVLTPDNKVLTNLHLRSDNPVARYGFDRFGELKELGKAVVKLNSTLTQGCFEMTLYPDGAVTPLILKQYNKFYAYTPMGGDKPYVTRSEDELRKFIFNEALYPLKSDDYYGIH